LKTWAGKKWTFDKIMFLTCTFWDNRTPALKSGLIKKAPD